MSKSVSPLVECRICLQPIPNQSLQPCNCRGSQAFVHARCLAQWITVRGAARCNVCQAEYQGIPLRRKHKGVFRWLLENPSLIVMLAAGCAVTFLISYALLLGFILYASSVHRAPNFLRIALLGLACFYCVVLTLVVVSSLIHTCIQFLRWRAHNYTVSMLPDTEYTSQSNTPQVTAASKRFGLDDIRPSTIIN